MASKANARRSESVLIRELPNSQRPRERLYALGVEALSDPELLALILRHGRPGESAMDLATRLLAEHGNLAVLAAARPEELARWPGIGQAKAAALVAAFRLGRRITTQETVPQALRGPADVASAARPLLADARRERVVVLVCDAANGVRQRVVVAEAAVDRTPVPVREILNAVLRHDGRAFAVAHNHPSGNREPSPADRQATADLAQAARTVGLRFLDHVVVAGEAWWSVLTGQRTPS
jgi:DNA repair protein RadC